MMLVIAVGIVVGYTFAWQLLLAETKSRQIHAMDILRFFALGTAVCVLFGMVFGLIGATLNRVLS